MRDLVSIIIPIFNSELFLEDMLKSVCTQTYTNIEIICVDDGSTDNSNSIVRSFSDKDERVVLIHQENKYAGIARNTGMANAHGRYICFLDSDDYIEKDYIAEMYKAISSCNADIVICGSKSLDCRTGIINELKFGLDIHRNDLPEVFSVKSIPDVIFQTTAGWAWDKMYNHEFIKKNNIYFQNTRIANDQLFVDVAYAVANSITCVYKSLIVHRIRVNGSLEFGRNAYWRCVFQMLSEERKQLTERNKYELVRRSFVNRAANYVLFQLGSLNNYEQFHEYYIMLKNTMMDVLDLRGHSREYFYEEYYYKLINYVDTCEEAELLLWMRECCNLQIDAIEIAHFCIQQELNITEDRLRLSEETVKLKRWVFREEVVKDDSYVAVYGYGDVGRDIVYQINNSKRLKLACVIEKNERKNLEDGIDVLCIDDINQLVFDVIIVAILREDIAVEVSSDINKKGIPKNKILWIRDLI